MAYVVWSEQAAITEAAYALPCWPFMKRLAVGTDPVVDMVVLTGAGVVKAVSVDWPSTIVVEPSFRETSALPLLPTPLAVLVI
jgi:hypothetical protein